LNFAYVIERGQPRTLISCPGTRQYRAAPARVYAYTDCPNCGRISKPAAEIVVVLDGESPNYAHCHFQCERCGSRGALPHLEREILSRH
jgi:phage terminase large subunit GpA-like protein